VQKIIEIGSSLLKLLKLKLVTFLRLVVGLQHCTTGVLRKSVSNSDESVGLCRPALPLMKLKTQKVY